MHRFTMASQEMHHIRRLGTGPCDSQTYLEILSPPLSCKMHGPDINSAIVRPSTSLWDGEIRISPDAHLVDTWAESGLTGALAVIAPRICWKTWSRASMHYTTPWIRFQHHEGTLLENNNKYKRCVCRLFNAIYSLYTSLRRRCTYSLHNM